MELHAIRIVKCNNCGEDVIINANYPINSVESCRNCGMYGQTGNTWNAWKNKGAVSDSEGDY